MSQTGRILMDDIDVYTTYGIYAIRGSFNDLVKLPAMKPASSYSWDTENGDDAYLEDRKIEARDIVLTFLMRGTSATDLWDKRQTLIEALTADGVRSIDFTTLGRSFAMYYISCDSARIIPGSKNLAIEYKLKFRLDLTDGESNEL